MTGPTWGELLDRHTPAPGARCHCGDEATWRIDPSHEGLCTPCDFAVHDSCECSQ